jgi:hypothetical protein
MIRRNNRSTRRKLAPVPLRPPQTPHAARTRTRAAAMGSQRLTNVQKHNICTNVPSSQTFRAYLKADYFLGTFVFLQFYTFFLFTC